MLTTNQASTAKTDCRFYVALILSEFTNLKKKKKLLLCYLGLPDSSVGRSPAMQETAVNSWAGGFTGEGNSYALQVFWPGEPMDCQGYETGQDWLELSTFAFLRHQSGRIGNTGERKKSAEAANHFPKWHIHESPNTSFP